MWQTQRLEWHSLSQASQGMPGAIRNCKRQGRSKLQGASPREASEESCPCWHILIADLQTPELWEDDFCCFKPPGLWEFVVAAHIHFYMLFGSRRSLRGGNVNPLQYSCLENPTDGGVWRAAVHGVAKSWTQLSTRAYMHVLLILLVQFLLILKLC